MRRFDHCLSAKPEASLDRLCQLALEAQLYRECIHYYPFVLGAQPVRPVDLAAFYAAIANEGLRPAPYVIDSVERGGTVVYRHDLASATKITSVDGAAFYQLKTMMQGVLARGTAHAISDLSPYVAGKTGTSDDENDAWFVGFTNDVTVAVWIGYDNAGNRRRTLGGGSTGGGVAVPIFEPIVRAAWTVIAPRAALAPPSPEARRQLSCKSIDLESGEIRVHGDKGITECFRVNGKGKIIDTKYRLETSESRMARHDQDDEDASRRKSPPRRYARAPRELVQAAQQWYFGQFGGQFGVAPPAAVRQPGGRQVGGAQAGVGQFGIFGWGR